MFLKEAPRHEMTVETAEFIELTEKLHGDDKRIAENAILQIRLLEEELQLEKRRVQEVTAFFHSWTEGFDDILMTPVNLENHEQLQIRYPALRNSAKNLIESCRKKISEFSAVRK